MSLRGYLLLILTVAFCTSDPFAGLVLFIIVAFACEVALYKH